MEKRITGHTELIGLMAYPIRHSSSPAMHNAAFAKLGLDYAYLAFEVDNDSLEGAVQGIRSLKLVGSNVSMPNKTVVHKYLDKLSPAAEMCGAVNTIVNEDGVLEAVPDNHNNTNNKFSNEEMQDPANQFEFTLYILNQYYVLLTRGIDGIRLGFWNGDNSFRKYMEETLEIQ